MKTTRNYQQIKNSVLKLGYVWNTRPNGINYIWERVDFKATNRFTDFLHVCYVDEKNQEIVLSIPATTKPGLKGSLLEPVTVQGVRGTAVIESPQQVIKGWRFVDKYDAFSKYPFFQQIGKVNYWRDGNKDTIIDKVQRQIGKIFGTNWHRMSNNETYGSGEVNNWSLGCAGAPEPEWIKILPITRLNVKLYGTDVNGTFLNSENFI